MKSRHIRFIRKIPIILFACSCISASASADSDVDNLSAYVKHEGIQTHLQAFQTIADHNGGVRSVRTNGDQLTRDYISGILMQAGLNVQRIPVIFEDFHELTPAVMEQVSPNSKTYIEGDPGASNIQFHITQNAGNGDITKVIQAVDIQDPPGATANSSTSGCTAGDFIGFVPGNIALIQRGGCLFEPKVANAITAGASGVILFNEGQIGRTGLIGTSIPTPVAIPVVFAEYAVGKELFDLSIAGPVSIRLKTSAELIHTETENIIAETKTGHSKHVVMLGAHLDSVEEGPGINDNGSAVGTLLEIAKGMQQLKINPLNQVRFAFWGAEESGQVGSTQYVDSLSEIQIKNIALYLNADMLGSPNYVPFVYDADASDLPFIVPGPPAANGSGKVEKELVKYFNSAGVKPKLLAIDQRSDYKQFLFAGIPFAAITSGFDAKKTEDEVATFGGTAGAPYDACYHKACDTINNVSNASLDLMSDALVHTIITFAKQP